MSLGVTTSEEQLIDEPVEIPSVDIASQTTTGKLKINISAIDMTIWIYIFQN